ncbi:MAG: hypothetical protein HQK62_15140 [Desulfamplus sp.]|nr:hypothetical protein [Desulfamplus sp.]
MISNNRRGFAAMIVGLKLLNKDLSILTATTTGLKWLKTSYESLLLLLNIPPAKLNLHPVKSRVKLQFFRKYNKFYLILLIIATASLLRFIPELHASDYLLFFEAQGVAGYSKQEDKIIWYSKTSEDVMQKPSVGFDYIQKFSGETSDFGLVALQARLSYDDRDKNLEPQLYNAY